MNSIVNTIRVPPGATTGSKDGWKPGTTGRWSLENGKEENQRRSDPKAPVRNGGERGEGTRSPGGQTKLQTMNIQSFKKGKIN